MTKKLIPAIPIILLFLIYLFGNQISVIIQNLYWNMTGLLIK